MSETPSLCCSDDYLTPNDVEIVRQTEMVVSHYNITWTFKNFSFFKRNTGETINLEPFTTGREKKIDWCLEFYPNGNKKDNDKYVSVFLKPLKEDRVTAKLEYSLLNEKGDKSNKFLVDIRLFSYRTGWGFERFIEREYLLDEDNGLLIDDTLTLYLELDVAEDLVNTTNEKYIPKTEVNCLADDFKNLFETKKLTDLTVTVGSEQFQVHKAILAARSSVFSAMYEHDMSEKNTNTLNIKDIEPKIMEEIFKYIYCGKCNVKEMASEILPASDKYNLLELKELCEETLLEQLTIDNASLTLILSDLHNLSKLKTRTLEFISINAKIVLHSCYWKSIAETHPHLEFEAYKYIIQRNILVDVDAKSEA